jgi:tetratricopeptide (TPR) repeat protein
VETKDYPASVTAFDALKRRATLNPQDMMKLGVALQQLKRDDEALQLLLSAVAAESTNCDPYFALGSIYMNKRDYANAAAMFEKKIACDPKSLSSYINASASLMQVGNLARARELLLQAIELKSDYLLARLWLGRVYALMDSLEMSGRQYDDVLRLIGTQTDKYRKEAGEATGQRGLNFFLTKQYERAIEYLKKAIGLGYENASIELTLGQALILSRGDNAEENKDKIKDAVKHFRQCVALEPGNAQGHLWLAQGLVFSRVEGDPGNKPLQEEACTEYKKVIKLEPRNQDAVKGMERIGCK